ncbi:actin-related protein 5-like, partial [Oppia nitens]|uniref:actin-related protein 5-like n=1 Tax=Oppia nitens TaxID=1686743 RepID=UPI0023DBA6F3
MDYMWDQQLIPFSDINYDLYRNTSTPIVIDWGAYWSRVGFASAVTDCPQLIFRSLISKQRAKKDSEVLVGNDIVDIEAVKRVLRSPFELDVVTQFDSMETIFDYMFANLAIDTTRVEHPIILNEAFCTPLWSRVNTQELMFECYDIPSLLLGVDFLFSLHHNLPEINNCLILCMGHYTCHIIPVIDGTVCSQQSSRINLGGLNLSLYLQRLMQLKYPKLTQEFTFTKCEQMVQRFCKFSTDYHSESYYWSEDSYYDNNVKRFKTVQSVNTTTEQSVAEEFVQRAQRLLKKVKTNYNKKREKQLSEWEESRNKLKTLLELVEDEELAEPALIAKAYQNAGVKNLNELRNKLNELNVNIKQIKTQLNPKAASEETVIDEIIKWQNQCPFDEQQWSSYVRQLRANKIGENAWLLNELLREYELECKRLKGHHGVADNVIEFGAELIRVPELFFSPEALINYSQCGISDAIEELVKKLNNPEISETLFITGGCANIEGIVERVAKDVTAMRPFGTPLHVIKAANPSYDAWKGMRDLSGDQLSDKFVSKQEYYEFGAGFLKQFKC